MEDGEDAFINFGEQILNRTYTDDIKQIMRSVWNFPITFGQSANSTGKTFCAGDIAVAWYKIFPGAKVFTFAAPPEENLKTLLWGQIGTTTEHFPWLFADDAVSLASLSIKRASEEFLTGVTIPNTGTEANRKARFSGKHAPYILFIGDEADAVPAEILDAIETCMTGGIKARLLLIFNPREARGKIYYMQNAARGKTIQLSAFNHPNVVTGKDVIPGAVNREDTVRRIMEWSRPLRSGEKYDASEVFDVPSYLIGHRAKRMDGEWLMPCPAGMRVVVEPELYHVVLARYPTASVHQLISMAHINLARSRWDNYVASRGEMPPTGVRPVLGQDVGELGTDESVCIRRYGNYVARMIKGEDTWAGTDTDVTATNASNIYRRTGAICCNVDGTGVGAGVWPQMEKQGCKANRVMMANSPTNKGVIEGLGTFQRTRDQLWWEVKRWIEKDHAMLPPDQELIDDLRTPTYRIADGKIQIMGKSIMREMLRRSPNKGDALCLTFAPENGTSSGGTAATVVSLNYAY